MEEGGGREPSLGRGEGFWGELVEAVAEDVEAVEVDGPASDSVEQYFWKM